MDLNLIREEEANKVPLSVRVYSSTYEALTEIVKAENVSLAGFVRHALNNAIAQYKEQTNKQ